MGNATRRVMYMVREEHAIELREAAQPDEEKQEDLNAPVSNLQKTNIVYSEDFAKTSKISKKG